MLIRCKLERPGGTKIDIDRVPYHFKPAPSRGITSHVCLVEDKDHIRRLITDIPEAYEPFLGEEGSDDDGGFALPVDTAPVTQTDENPPAPVEPRPATSTAPVTQDPPAPVQAEPVAKQAEQPDGEPPLEEMEREHLVAKYEKLAGRKPNGKIGTDTLIAKIREMEAELQE